MENVYIDQSTANILQPDTKTPSKHIMKPYRRSNKVFMVEILWWYNAELGAFTLCYDDLSVLLFAVLDKVVNDFPDRCQLSFYNYGFLKDASFRRATRLGRVRVLIREFAGDVRSLWKYGAPFPTFLKLIGTLILCLIVLLPLIYPFFILIITYFTYESLYLSWYRDQPWRFLPRPIARRALSAAFHPSGPQDIWKVREVLTRGILLAHSLATSVDYLCVMQGLLDET